MTEPFMTAVPGAPEPSIYSEPAPIEYKSPDMRISLMPMTRSIMIGERLPYSSEEMAREPAIADEARRNAGKNKIKRSRDEDFISIRSNGTDMPCAAMFLIDSREAAIRSIGVEPRDSYFMFITPDEVLIAPKESLRPSNIRKAIANIEKKLSDEHPEGCPMMLSGIFEYDELSRKYVEI